MEPQISNRHAARGSPILRWSKSMFPVSTSLGVYFIDLRITRKRLPLLILSMSTLL